MARVAFHWKGIPAVPLTVAVAATEIPLIAVFRNFTGFDILIPV